MLWVLCVAHVCAHMSVSASDGGDGVTWPETF